MERQNRVNPVVKMESFEAESAARNVLIELTEIFYHRFEEQELKIKALGDVNVGHKERFEGIDNMIKRITTNMQETLSYDRRI